jgi:hypothetical protein
MQCDETIGGKVTVFRGDFRQVLPIAPNARRVKIIELSFILCPGCYKMLKTYI